VLAGLAVLYPLASARLVDCHNPRHLTAAVSATPKQRRGQLQVMSTSPHVAGVCGSLRDASYTRIALDHALTAAADRGASTALVDLREYDLPVFDANHRDAGDAERLQETIQRADSVLLGSPMYHGSYSSALKNALDYCGFDEFENTTVGLLAVSGGAFRR